MICAAISEVLKWGTWVGNGVEKGFCMNWGRSVTCPIGDATIPSGGNSASQTTEIMKEQMFEA